jgi:hypothetical protein
MEVEGIFVDANGLATTRVSFEPRKTLPWMVFSQKVAGAIAVEIQNERQGLNDDIGFGEPTNQLHDAWTAARILQYLADIAPGFDVAWADASMRAATRENLIARWNVVEAIAREVEPVLVGGGVLTGNRINEIIQAEMGKVEG